MFAEVKELLTFIEPEEESYDAQIIAEIKACALDLTRTAEIVLPGVIDISREKVLGKWVITDNSTITDQLLIQAIITYVRLHFGTPDDYDKLERSYNEQKAQLITASGYGLPAGEES